MTSPDPIVLTPKEMADFVAVTEYLRHNPDAVARMLEAGRRDLESAMQAAEARGVD